MSNKSRTTLYIGVTNDLEIRVLQHKIGKGSIFTSKYRCFHLLYFEEIPGMDEAIAREKQLKNWRKDWKWDLIKSQNPNLVDLAADWYKPEEIEDFLRNYEKQSN